MKLLYFNYLYTADPKSIGPIVQITELAKSLENFGHQVTLIFSGDGTGNPKISHIPYVSIRIRGFLKKLFSTYLHDPKQLALNIQRIYQERMIIKRETPDIIMARLEVYNFSSLLLSKMAHIPYMVFADSPLV